MKGGNRTDADRAPEFDTPSFSSRSRVNVLSDAYVTQDFFADQYIRDQQPNTFLDAMYQDPNFTVTMNARTQINNLFQTQQQKPSAKIEFKRQYIPGTYDKEELFKDPNANPGLAYEGESSVGPALGFAPVKAVIVKVLPTWSARTAPVFPFPVVVKVWKAAAPGVFPKDPPLA